MPIKIRWKSRDYVGITFILLGASGLFQMLYILIGQYFFKIANYFIMTIIPIVTIVALFYSNMVIFESFAEVNRKNQLKSQFSKKKAKKSFIFKILEFPVSKPLLISFGIFTIFFFIGYGASITFLESFVAFIIAENIGAIATLLIANLFERNYAKIRRL